MPSKSKKSGPSIIVLGVGSFAQSTAQILRDAGAETSIYLTRKYAQFSPTLAGQTFSFEEHPCPVQ